MEMGGIVMDVVRRKRGGAYANRRKSRGKMEWRGIKLTLDEREKKREK